MKPAKGKTYLFSLSQTADDIDGAGVIDKADGAPKFSIGVIHVILVVRGGIDIG